MRIGQKISFGFLSVVSLIGVIGVSALYYQNKIIENDVLNQVKTMESYFFAVEKRDTKILAATLETFIQDQAFKDAYLEKNREKLYDRGRPLFENLKRKYGITHFYFILPDGRCFLRLHDKDIYGDQITRFTFEQARDTRQAAAGIELGKTAFALRVVMPYYNGGELIGYVELGEEINHFLNITKGSTNNEFSIFVEKEHLKREDWRSSRKVAGLRDNWDDLKKHVLVTSTNERRVGEIFESYSKKSEDIAIEKILERIEKGEKFFRQAQIENVNFGVSGFELRDASGRRAGTVLSLVDLSDTTAIAQKSNVFMLFIVGTICIMALTAGLLIANSISVPITRLSRAVFKIGKGELDTKIEINSKDEIGELAASFNKMTSDLKSFLEREKEFVVSETKVAAETRRAEEFLALNQQLRAREEQLKASNQQLKANEQQLKAANQQLRADEQTLLKTHEELKNKLADLELFEEVTIGRELKMVDLKKEINGLLKELGRDPKYEEWG